MPLTWLQSARLNKVLLQSPPHFAGVEVLAGRANAEARARTGHAVLVGQARHLKWLTFACPCGCGAILDLNLMRTHTPCWRVTRHRDRTISAMPSVWTTTCGSHFWIVRSRIRWV
jgi:hypothetical protein